MGKESKTLDINSLKDQAAPLSEEQIEQLGRDALAEMEGDHQANEDNLIEEEVKKKSASESTEEVEEKTEEKPEEKSDEELLKAEDDKLSEEDKKRKGELIEAKEKAEKEESERILNAKEEELSEEDKIKKTEIVKKQEEIKLKAFEDDVKALSEKEGISEDDARKELESTLKIQEKYGADPKQLARANLHLQRQYSRTEAKLKQIEQHIAESRKVTIEQTIEAIDAGKIKIKGEPASRELIIETYRKQEPKITENADDETVLRLAAKAIKEGFEAQTTQEIKQRQEETKQQSSDKKQKLISSLPESDKAFIPEIKPILDKISDAHILDEDFSLEELILYAKGKKYDAMVKQLKETEEKAYKRGLEQAKIIGVKDTPIGKGSNDTKKASKTTTLTPAQKERAMAMYGEVMSEKEAYEAYIDYLKTEK